MQRKIILLAFFCLLFGSSAFAQRFAVATGNWDGAIWATTAVGVAGSAATPTASDAVTINSGVAVTVNVPASCASLEFSLAISANSLTISGTNSLSVTGLISMPTQAIVGKTTTLAVGAGTLTAGSLNAVISILGSNNVISISTGSTTISGAFTTGATAGIKFTLTGAGILEFGGTIAVGTSTMTTAAGSTVKYSDAGAQTVIPGQYSNLTLAGSGAKTTSSVTVNGVLSMEGTATASVAPTYDAAAMLQYNTTTGRTAGVEWLTPFAATGGVTIGSIGTITLNAAKVFNASVPLTINSGATLATGNFQMSFGGNFNNSSGTLTAGSSPIVINNTMTTQSIAGFTTTGLVSMTKASGTATFTGNVNGAGLTINGVGGGTLNLGTALTHTFTDVVTLTAGTLNGGSSTLNENAISATAWNGTGSLFTAGTGTVNFGGVAQTLSATTTTFNNLTLSNSGAKTFTNANTVNGVLSMEGTATASLTGALTYGASATLQYNTATSRTADTEWATPFVATGGVIIANTGSITLNAAKVFNTSVPLTINSGATLNTSGSNFQLSFGGNFVNSGGTFTANASPIVVTNTMTTQSIAGFTTTGLVSMTKASGTATFTGNVNGAGLTINGVGGGTLNLGTALTHTFTDVVTLTAGTLNGGSSTLNENAISATAWNGTGSVFSAGTGTVNFGATGAQTIAASATTFNNLSLSNSSGVTLGADVTVNGTLTFSAGKITTSTNRVILGSSATISGAGAGKYVFGNLRRNIPATTSFSAAFDIGGDATNYTPVTILLSGTPGGSGFLDASTTAAQPPGASGISQTKYVNRSWTVTNSGVTGFTSYSPTFTFVGGDIIGGANTANFIIAKNDAGTWTQPTVGTKTGTTTQATGLTSFSEFGIGEQAATADLSSIALSGSPANYTFAAGTYTYNAVTVANGVASITITPTGAGIITVDGVTVASGVASGAISLTAGTPQSIVIVATETGKSAKTYTINVTRNDITPTPTFSPVAGAIAFGTTVTISSTGADAIYYTTDGSDPTIANTLYAAPVAINSALTLKALAVKAGYDNSAIGSAAYTQAASADLTGLVLSGSPSNYTFASGTYTYNGVTVANPVSSVTITPTGAGTITVDGTTISSGSPSGAINLTAGVEKTILVVATESGKSAKTYTIKVTRSLDPSKAITAFTILGDGTVNEGAKTIAVTVPYGTDVTALVATFTTTGASVKVGAVTQTSGTTANNFTSPVTYTVTAADASTQDYVVTVTVAADPSKALTAFTILGNGTVNEGEKTITVAVPCGTDVTALVATFTTTGVSVKVGSTTQVSGTTANDFTNPVTYTVTAADATTQDYVVTVTVAADPSKALTAFTILGNGTVNEGAKTIAVTVPYGTNVTSLVASFSTTGVSVKVGSTEQTSGTTANNFTSPVTYTVTAADASTQDYVVTVTVALNPAKAITAFTILGNGTVNEGAKTVAVTVPYGTDVTALVATFTTTGASVKVGATSQVSGTTANDFTSPVTYTVTAADASTQDYVVSVTVALNPAKAITAFTILGNGTVNEGAKTIAVTVPYGTDVTALVATFTTTGASVKVGAVTQTSGTTANNFTSPVTYTVTAADASTQDYVVSVTVALNPAKAITAFTILGNGTVNEGAKTIAVTVPYGTDVTALVATFTTTGASVKVGAVTQTSGTTANNFSSPVTYTVTAADASTQDYVVTVTVALNPAKAITAFTILGNGTVNESAKTVAVTVPYGTDVTALVATFTTTGASVKVGAVTQTSGTTANNFTSPVTYTVTAADASTQDYVVTVTVASNTSKTITAFTILGNGTVNESAKTIAVSVAYGTDVTALVASFSTTGASVKIGAVTQTSGSTANNFSSPVTYTVTAADASTQDYVVTVTVALNPAKAITAFTILGNGTVNESAKTIAVTVPYGTNLTALVATFTTTGASVKVGATSQVSGTTANDFTSPVIYTVIAADASTQDYVVSVTVALNPAKAITAFTILGNGTVNESAKTIAVSVPYGTDITAMAASFSISGASVKVGAVTQTSGSTVNNFSSPVTYTVTAADASTQDYVVTVTVAANTAKAITAFTLVGSGTVNESAKTIAVTVPYGTNLTALVATFITTGASVKVGATSQVSGTTANDFTSPVTYTVTAADASTQDYVVTVTVALNPAKAITAFTILGNGTVNESAKTIAVSVAYGTDVTALVASFSTTGASVKIGAVTQTSGSTANNFSSPVTYTVTAADASTQDYVVTVTVAANPAKAITAFTILGNGTVNEGAKTIAVSVPFGTDISTLVASFSTTGASVKVGATNQTSGTTVNNYSSPVTYTVTAADSSTQNYVVTVSVSSNTSKAFTAFTINGNGSINESTKTIAVTVPYGTNITALAASFSTTGASVKVGSITQTSGTTVNDFSSPVTYTVTAADASTQDYVVSVTVALNPAKAITAFTILGNGSVNESAKTIAVSVPYGTSLTALVATFTTSGASVKIGATTQVSGTTANNFSSTVIYTVTAADNSTQDYEVTVSVSASTNKAITAFSILGNGTINESAKTITVTVPYGTSVTALVASFSTTGASLKVGSVTQTSGTTANNFSSPVTYTVTASDASTQDYVVTVTVASNPAKAITAFTILGNGTVNESAKTIAVTLPFGTNVTALAASFSTTGASVRVSGITQTSGTTANDFSSPVTYTVTAADASTQDYVVTVTVAPNPAKAITAFTILGNGTVNESARTIAVTVPFGTSLTALVATFTTSGTNVKIGTDNQSSGITANNFNSPVTYTVTAADATTVDYLVTVSVASNTSKALTAFTILGNGTVNESAKTIAVTVPYGTNLNSLVATFNTSGASVKVAGLTQVSGTTANNFSSPLTYTVTAADSSTQNYVVRVTVAENPAKSFTAFTILGNGTVNESAKTIVVTLPFGTAVTALVATFNTTGTSVKVKGVTQTSGVSVNNFSSTLTYTVTAANATTQDYMVTVNVAQNSAKAITAFSILGNGTVNESAKTIAVSVPSDTDLTSLVASFTTTGVSVKVGATSQTSGITPNNFSSPVTYTVTAADASVQNYVATVAVDSNLPGRLTAGTIGTDQITCKGFTVALTQITAATGGSGSYTYQWQKSILSSSTGFTDIAGATGSAYEPGNLSITTWYRRMTSSPGYNSVPLPSNVVTITVIPPVSNNLIIAPAITNFCQSADPARIIGTTPSGGNGNYTYQWRYGKCTGTCRPIIGATSKDYDPGVLTRTTYFSREVISGGCVYSSNYIIITVTPPLISNIISGNQTIISGNKPGNLTGAVPSGGDTKKVYLWESSILSDTSGFVPAAGINNLQNYSPEILTQTTFFRRKASSGVCAITYSNGVKITVTSINHQPVAFDDNYTAKANTTLTILSSEGVLLNDTDPDNDPLQASVQTLPAHGTLIFDSNGGFTYKPATDFTGKDSFIYNVCDNITPQLCDTATVTMNVISSQGLGIAKAVSTPMRQLDGFDSNILTYKITVKNYGNVSLKNVQVADDLTKTFPFPTQFSLEGTTSTSKGILVPNTAFDGRGNSNLLKLNNTLPRGESDTIKFTIKVTPYNYIMGPYYNSARASATDPAGNLTEDISTEGTDPDPDINGIPDESNATIVMLEKVTVRIPEGFSPNGDGVNDMFVIENLDNEQISLQVFNSLGALVYKNINYKNDWAGVSNQRNYSGKEIPNGTYFYIVSKRNNMENYVSFITVTR